MRIFSDTPGGEVKFTHLNRKMVGIQEDLLPLLVPIQKDISDFLIRFSKLKPSHSSSFETFKIIWHEMHLHLIYSCRPIEELFIFQDLVLDTVKQRLFPPYASLWNVGAIFLLFAFIELVPYKRHMSCIKPRMTLDDLKKVQNLMRYLRVEEENEASVILLYILQNHCLIVAQPMSDLHVDIKKQYSHRSLQNGYLNLVQAANAVTSDLTNMTLDNYIADQLESFGFLEKMTATNRQYCAMKSLTPDVTKSSLCTLIGPDLIGNFAESIPVVQHETLKSKSKDKDIGNRRASLKNKAFSKDQSKRKSQQLPDSKRKNQEHADSKSRKRNEDFYDGSKSYMCSRGSKVPTLESASIVEKIGHQRSRCRNHKTKNSSDKKLKRIAKKIKKVHSKEQRHSSKQKLFGKSKRKNSDGSQIEVVDLDSFLKKHERRLYQVQNVVCWESPLLSFGITLVLTLIFYFLSYCTWKFFASLFSVLSFSAAEISEKMSLVKENLDRYWKWLINLRRDKPSIFCLSTSCILFGLILITWSISGLTLVYLSLLGLLCGPAVVKRATRSRLVQEYVATFTQFLSTYLGELTFLGLGPYFEISKIG
ncbi:hypothetical protein M8J75_016393 [Diaphorina citri]|nr:hypothetical protein M8J75_016393 [Diaphorina citri]